MEQKMIIHNRFDVSVVDSRTGEEKQKAVGYNVILDNFFTSRIKGSPCRVGCDLLAAISFGTGTGVLSTTRTDLFSRLAMKEAITVKTVYAYPTSYVQKQIKLEATEYNGKNLTEVGFMGKMQLTGAYYYQMTHAMLKDSEGNQIAIQKTDVDIVYITATFYCTLEPSGFGEGAVYPEASKNCLIKSIFTGSAENQIYIGRLPIEKSNELTEKNTGSKIYSILNGTGNMETMTFDSAVLTFLDTEINNKVIRHFGIAGVGAFTFPNHEVFPPYEVERMVIGKGDGVTTEFNVKCPMIMPESETVYVDNAEMERDVDYVIDYENNCINTRENYHSAALSCKDANVQMGNLREKAPYTSAALMDPLSWWSNTDTSFYPSNFQISESKPMQIDFLEPKDCNRFMVEVMTIQSTYLDKMKIQYSLDAVEWTDVVYTREGQIYKWDMITAQHWKIFVQGVDWHVSLNRYGTAREGLGFGTSFFLGKTVPGLRFINPPAENANIEIKYFIEYPFKTPNNLLRFTMSIKLQRG